MFPSPSRGKKDICFQCCHGVQRSRMPLTIVSSRPLTNSRCRPILVALPPHPSGFTASSQWLEDARSSSTSSARCILPTKIAIQEARLALRYQASHGLLIQCRKPQGLRRDSSMVLTLRFHVRCRWADQLSLAAVLQLSLADQLSSADHLSPERTHH